jgi:putative transposase
VIERLSLGRAADAISDAASGALFDYRSRCSIGRPASPVESAQYTSIDYTQTLTDHRVLASVGSVGDAYDNALAQSFVDSFKTELIADRVWRTRSQLELAVVEYIGWYNAARLHESIGDVPPAEYEQLHADREATTLAGATV